MNKRIYEKMLLAGEVISFTSQMGKRWTMLNSIYYFMEPGDGVTEAYDWLVAIGESASWEEHLTFLVDKMLDLKPCPQDWRGNIHTELSKKLTDKNFYEYFTNYYKPLINNLLLDCRDIWESKLKTKIYRGASIESQLLDYLIDTFELNTRLEMKPYVGVSDSNIVEKTYKTVNKIIL